MADTGSTLEGKGSSWAQGLLEWVILNIVLMSVTTQMVIEQMSGGDEERITNICD